MEKMSWVKPGLPLAQPPAPPADTSQRRSQETEKNPEKVLRSDHKGAPTTQPRVDPKIEDRAPDRGSDCREQPILETAETLDSVMLSHAILGPGTGRIIPTCPRVTDR